MYNGIAKLVGIRYKKIVYSKDDDELDFLLDFLIAGSNNTFHNLQWSIKESYGEIPMIGEYYWIMINDKDVRILDDV